MDFQLGALEAHAKGAKVAGVGVVRWVGPSKDVRTWTGAVVEKREVELVDAALSPRTLAVWGRAASRAAGALEPPAVVSYAARVSDYGGRSLNGDAAPAPAARAALARLFAAPGVAAAALAASNARRDAAGRGDYARPRDAATFSPRDLARGPRFAATWARSLPPGHVLESRAGAARGDGRAVARAVFGPRADDRRTRRRLAGALPLFARLRANYARARVGRVFDATCGPARRRGDAAAARVDAALVARFACRVVRRVVPRALWGSARNERAALGSLDALFRLGAGDAVTPRRLREALREADVAWPRGAPTRGARPPSDLRRSRELLERFLAWVSFDVAAGLVSARFVVKVSRGRVAYYRRADFAAVEAAAVRACPALAAADDAPAGCATLAAEPKDGGGVRVVQRVGARGARPPGAASLHDCALALRLEARRNPALLGFGGAPDALWRCLRAAKGAGDAEGLTLDAARCFDGIDQARLLDVAERALVCEAYRIHGGKRATPGAPGAAPRTRLVRRDAVVAELRRHVSGHAARLRGACFRQVAGIPQGSVASAVLCDLYYGAFERARAPPGCRAARVVDDTFAVGPRGALAALADAYAVHGPPLGIVVNAAKARATFARGAAPAAAALSFCGVQIALAGGAVAARAAPRPAPPRGPPAGRFGRAAPRDAALLDRLRRAVRARARPPLLDAALLGKEAAAANLRDLFAAAADAAAPAVAHLRPSSKAHVRRALHAAATFAYAVHARAVRAANRSEARPRLSLFDFLAAADDAWRACRALRAYVR